MVMADTAGYSSRFAGRCAWRSRKPVASVNNALLGVIAKYSTYSLPTYNSADGTRDEIVLVPYQ